MYYDDPSCVSDPAAAPLSLCNGCVFLNNSASYGEDYASGPVYLPFPDVAVTLGSTFSLQLIVLDAFLTRVLGEGTLGGASAVLSLPPTQV